MLSGYRFQLSLQERDPAFSGLPRPPPSALPIQCYSNMSFSNLLKKASNVLQNLGIGETGQFLGKDGDIVYSKNNVCVHAPASTGKPQLVNSPSIDESNHSPGYLTIHCQHDEVLGVTLVLQWLPNATLEKNPKSIRTISPRSSKNHDQGRARIKLRHLQGDRKVRRESSSDSSGSVHDTAGETTTSLSETEGEQAPLQFDTSPTGTLEKVIEPQISVQMEGDKLTVTTTPDRPHTLDTDDNGAGLSVPNINVIPNTPVGEAGLSPDIDGRSSPPTSGADDGSDQDDDQPLTSPYTSEGDDDTVLTPTGAGSQCHTSLLLRTDWVSSPEEFAQSHNLMLPDGIRPGDESNVSVAANRAHFQKSAAASLFSVDLGKMRSMRLFYNSSECTCGQLVIASPESQYKILHFHHGGLDKLAQIFEQWNAVRAKSVKDGSPSPKPDRHFAICRGQVSKSELDPEEGLYDRVSWDFWRASTNSDGGIEDNTTVCKAIFFASCECSLRKEAWPFLLRVYPWNSSREQRETIKNDLYLAYNNVRKKRMKESLKIADKMWHSVENTINKDVIRTDRKNPFYEGDNNPNIETMKNILMNYAVFCPQICYIQGMSDLLAPLLSIIRDESDSFWCFAGLMQRTIFVSIQRNNNNMDKNLEYLRELLKLMYNDFFKHLVKLGSEATQLMFTHRWILLCFKREFPEQDVLRIWESCWADYRTQFFHLFVSVAIITTYGNDIVAQALPHDEILLYFASLAKHMDADIVLKKARGLLYQFCRLDKIPCTLAGICDFQSAGNNMWDSAYQPSIECVQIHGDHEPCPFATESGFS